MYVYLDSHLQGDMSTCLIFNDIMTTSKSLCLSQLVKKERGCDVALKCIIAWENSSLCGHFKCLYRMSFTEACFSFACALK